MDKAKGSAFLLKMGDGQEAPKYTTVAGLRVTKFTVDVPASEAAEKNEAGWRELLSDADVHVSSVSVSGHGVFTGSFAETRVKNTALSGVLDDYELSFEDGIRLRGQFLIARLDLAGHFNGERSYTISLESSGTVVTL